MKIHMFRFILLLLPIFYMIHPVSAVEPENKTIRVRDSICTLSLGDLSLSVSVAKGGRIISFKRGNQELLTSSEIHPVYFGSTFWLSPQSEYWPPYPALDQNPYEIVVENEKARLSSRIDSVAGIRMVKEFSVSRSDTAILIDYLIENISGSSKQLAPWDVTRVPGGFSFFPVGENSEQNRSDVDGAYEEKGMMWFPFTRQSNEKGQKLFYTAREGWMAHQYQGLLFVKCFPDIQPEEMPPGQGEAEIYVAPKGLYVELENHGKYVTLQPGESVMYRQKWFLIPLPDNTNHRSSLLTIIKQLNKQTD